MIHVHSPPALDRRKVRQHCSTCGKRRTIVGWFYEWYGWLETCLGCGEQWSGGEQLSRPFERGWRQKRIKSAKRKWSGPK